MRVLQGVAVELDARAIQGCIGFDPHEGTASSMER